MEDIIYHPQALDKLEVESTATAAADPSYFMFEEWCTMTVLQKMETILNKQDLTCVMYLNTNFEFQSVSIISSPANCLQQNEWRMGQIGNQLSRGPEDILFNLDDIYCSIVVPMQEPYAKTGIIVQQHCHYQYWQL